MLFTTIGADWFIKTLALLFVWALDSIAYFLVSISYNIFTAVSQLNLFATGEGKILYDTIVDRFYTILSIAMIFVFAYFLIMMIIDPDGKNGKASPTGLVKETIISLIAIAVLPTVYNYMSLFQTHVLQENTIGTIILGGNGLSGTNAGKNISMIVFSAFYHPTGSTYSTFLGADGKMIARDTAISACEAGGASKEICDSYYDGLNEWLNDTDNESLYAVTGRKALRHSIGDEGGMEYMWVLSTGCAILVAYFFFSYAIDLGTRAVKLGFLQIVSPVPIMLRIFPTTKKTYDTWFTEIKNTYLEVFLRVAVIFFIVLLCQNVPVFIGALWNANDSVDGGLAAKALATVALILGLLKFAKDAPALFKSLFASGGMFAGLDLKPGVKRRINENDYAMKGLSTAVGGVGGMAGSAFMRAYQSYRKNSSGTNATTKEKAANAGRAALAGLSAAPRGLITGGRQGFKNTPSSITEMGSSWDAGRGAGQTSLNRAENQHQELLDTLKEIKSDGKGYVGKKWADAKEKGREAFEQYAGLTAAGNAALETINKSSDVISKYMDLASKAVEPYDKAFDDLRKKLIKGESVNYGGREYSLSGDPAGAYQSYFAAGGKQNAKGEYWNPDTKDFDKNYDPTKDPAHASAGTGSLSDLKELFDKAKNQEVASTINKKYKTGGATYMATLQKQLEKEIGNLGSQTISELNKKVLEANIAGINDVNQLLTHMSDKNATITSQHIAALDGVKSVLSNQSKNIVISNQQQAAQKKDNKDGK